MPLAFPFPALPIQGAISMLLLFLDVPGSGNYHILVMKITRRRVIANYNESNEVAPMNMYRSREKDSNDKPARSATRDKAATRQRILDAAETVFAEKGYHDTAVDDIIKVAEMSKGGFYFHFPNKQSIFLALMSTLTPRLIAATEEAIAHETNTISQLDAALNTALETFSRHRRLSKILLIEAVSLGNGFEEKQLEIRTQFAHLIQQYLDKAIAEGIIPPQNTELAAFAWLGAINELVVRWLTAKEPRALEAIIPDLRALLLRSVGVPIS